LNRSSFFSAFEKAAEKSVQLAPANGSYDQWATGQTRFAQPWFQRRKCIMIYTC